MSLRPSTRWGWVTDVISLVATIVWALSFVADVLIPAYNPPTQVHIAFLGAQGFYYGVRLVRTNGNGSSAP